MKKGITFVPKEEPSKEAIVKLNKLISDRDLRIEKMVDEYRKSKQEILLNFSYEFVRSEYLNDPIVVYALETLRQGEDVYKVLEFLITKFVERDKSQMEVMRQLIDNINLPGTFSAEKE